MDVSMICKQIAYLERALRETAPESAPDPSLMEGAKRKAKEIQKLIREYRKLGLKRKGKASSQLAPEADGFEADLNRGLEGSADA